MYQQDAKINLEFEKTGEIFRKSKKTRVLKIHFKKIDNLLDK